MAGDDWADVNLKNRRMDEMDDFFRNKWVSGVLLPCVAVVWGVSSLVSREIIIPIR